MATQNQAIVFRSPNRILVAAIWFAFASLGVFAVVIGGDWPRGLYLAETVAFLILGVRALRSSIVLDERGVTGRSDYYTHRLSWGDVERFGYRRLRGVGAWTTAGKWVRLREYGWIRREAPEIVARLEEVRQRMQ